VFADRRRGIDRREIPRRQVLILVSLERRSVVDRRMLSERRSTLDRRGRTAGRAATESPAEHLRNALQLLGQLPLAADLSPEDHADLTAAVERMQRALRLLERR